MAHALLRFYYRLAWVNKSNRNRESFRSLCSKLNNIRTAPSDWFDANDESKMSNTEHFCDSGMCGPREQPIIRMCVFVHAKQSTVHGMFAGVAGVCLCIVWFSSARNWCGICIHSKAAHAPHARHTHRYRRPWRSTVNYKSTNGRQNISIIIPQLWWLWAQPNVLFLLSSLTSLHYYYWIRIYG